ncbi:MAG: glycosyltransferase, partial [Planctomycetota bacterium]
PGLSHGHVPHGIPRGSLIERDRLSEAAYAGREFDVVVAGSIHSREELAVLRRAVPTQAQPWIDEIVALMAAEPWMPFEQAMDLVMGSRGVITGAWGTMSAVWRVVTAELNREQRTRMVSGLQGLDVAVFGGSAWGEQCAGSIRYAGQCAYSELPRALARGRACLAWGPTQFEHTFSERLLLSMAAGCASVADDRYMIGRHFGFDGADASVRVFDARQPGACRAAFEAVLSDPAAMVALARQGRAAVEAGHLWSHRVDSIASLGLGAIAEAESRPPSLVRPASAERRSA